MWDLGALGLLIPPHPPQVNWGQFDWQRFCPVRFGMSVRRMDCNLVAADPQRAMIRAITKIHGSGHHRIGLVYNVLVRLAKMSRGRVTLLGQQNMC